MKVICTTMIILMLSAKNFAISLMNTPAQLFDLFHGYLISCLIHLSYHFKLLIFFDTLNLSIYIISLYH